MQQFFLHQSLRPSPFLKNTFDNLTKPNLPFPSSNLVTCLSVKEKGAKLGEGKARLGWTGLVRFDRTQRRTKFEKSVALIVEMRAVTTLCLALGIASIILSVVFFLLVSFRPRQYLN